MNMTPEEKVSQETWYVLQKLREKSLVTTSNHATIMRSTHVTGGDFPSDSRVKEILLKLREIDAIKIVNDRYQYVQYLIPCQPYFTLTKTTPCKSTNKQSGRFSATLILKMVRS